MSGDRLRPLRRHEILHRFRYEIRHPGPDGAPATWTVDIDTSAGWDARLYLDGRRVATAEMPARLPVPGGRIDVDAGLYGTTRIHLVPDSGPERRLSPVPGTLEYRRARLARRRPGASRAIAVTAVLILAVNLVLAAPQALELITAQPRIDELVGTFTSPVSLPAWLNTTLLVAGALAATERVLTLRRNRVLDAETLWTGL